MLIRYVFVNTGLNVNQACFNVITGLISALKVFLAVNHWLL